MVEQAEIAEKSAKKFEPSASRGKWGMNNKGRSDLPQSSQAKGKETMSVELSGDVQLIEFFPAHKIKNVRLRIKGVQVLNSNPR